MIEDLKIHLRNPKDKNQKILNALEDKQEKVEWYAGGQLGALRHYLGSEAKIVATAEEGSYSGEVFAIIFVDGIYFLWRDSFGSCSGCDALDGLDEDKGYDYIINTMTSVKEFCSIKEVWKYLENPEDYFYESKEILKKLKENFNKTKILIKLKNEIK